MATDPVDAGAAELVELARLRGLTLATAESLTGGLVAATIVSVPGASHVLLGGVVAYSAAVKCSLLGVDPALVARVGTVDEEVAVQMAEGGRRATGADLAVATTGVAGPGPAEGRPAGTVWIACADASGAVTRELHLDGDRDAVRRGSVAAALDLLREVVSRSSAPRGTVGDDAARGPEESR